VRAAWDSKERGRGDGGDEGRPGRKFVGVVGDYEGACGKDAVVPGGGVALGYDTAVGVVGCLLHFEERLGNED